VAPIAHQNRNGRDTGEKLLSFAAVTDEPPKKPQRQDMTAWQ
jgi:hypothetical protein